MKKDLIKTLAIQSFCFRGFKQNAEVIARLKECGLSAIELCGVHADLSNAAAFDEVVRQYRDAGVKIVSTGVNTFDGNEGKERLLCEFARKAGCLYMSVNFQPGTSPASWRTAEKLATEYDLHLGIHNHGGRHWLGSVAMLSHVLANTSPRVGLCLDTAWALDAGEDPVAMVEKFGPRVYGVHFKDFVFDRARKHKDVVIGTGNLDLAKLFAALDKTGFHGYSVIEYEGDVNQPVPALRECVAAIRAAAGA